MKQPSVLVLLAVHNAGRRLSALLESILHQQDVQVTIQVLDNGSTDETWKTLQEFAGKYDCIGTRRDPAFHNTTETMLTLIRGVDPQAFDFFAIAEQGCRWTPDHLFIGCSRISSNSSRAELYYCGVGSLDSASGTGESDVLRYIPCAEHPLSLLVVKNWAFGGGMVFNGALVKLLKKRPVHDPGRGYATWIHAVALFCGYVVPELDRVSVSRWGGFSPEKGEEEQDAEQQTQHEQRPRRKRGFPAAITHMATRLYYEYRNDMDFEVSELVRVVIERGRSRDARRYLSRCKDIVAPQRESTLKLRRDLLRGRL